MLAEAVAALLLDLPAWQAPAEGRGCRTDRFCYGPGVGVFPAV